MTMTMEGLRDRLRSDERTDLTEKAHALALTSLRAAESVERFGYEIEAAGGALWILTRGYMTEVRGQSSAGGHGKQGSAPERIAALRELPIPARIVFVDQGARKWQEVWLDIDEPEVVNVDNDTTHRRQGWRVKDMIRGEGLLDFPDEAPTPREAPQGALL